MVLIWLIDLLLHYLLFLFLESTEVYASRWQNNKNDP
jgi:hypothetical protein